MRFIFLYFCCTILVLYHYQHIANAAEVATERAARRTNTKCLQPTPLDSTTGKPTTAIYGFTDPVQCPCLLRFEVLKAPTGSPDTEFDFLVMKHKYAVQFRKNPALALNSNTSAIHAVGRYSMKKVKATRPISTASNVFIVDSMEDTRAPNNTYSTYARMGHEAFVSQGFEITAKDTFEILIRYRATKKDCDQTVAWVMSKVPRQCPIRIPPRIVPSTSTGSNTNNNSNNNNNNDNIPPAPRIPVSSPVPIPISTSVVGGSPADTRIRSMLVSFVRGGNLVCSGSLISDYWVLTAAHCRVNSGDVAYVGGITGFSGIPRAIGRVVQYPNFEPEKKNSPHDIALVYLGSQPWKNASLINPVALNARKNIPGSLDILRIAGYGRISEGFQSIRPAVLRSVDLPVFPPDQCRTIYDTRNIKLPYPINSDTQICAGYEDGECDACQGDSGAPGFSYDSQGNPVQLALVSFGMGCARDGVPGVYTKVQPYLPWIKSIIKGKTSTGFKQSSSALLVRASDLKSNIDPNAAYAGTGKDGKQIDPSNVLLHGNGEVEAWMKYGAIGALLLLGIICGIVACCLGNCVIRWKEKHTVSDIATGKFTWSIKGPKSELGYSLEEASITGYGYGGNTTGYSGYGNTSGFFSGGGQDHDVSQELPARPPPVAITLPEKKRRGFWNRKKKKKGDEVVMIPEEFRDDVLRSEKSEEVSYQMSQGFIQGSVPPMLGAQERESNNNARSYVDVNNSTPSPIYKDHQETRAMSVPVRVPSQLTGSSPSFGAPPPPPPPPLSGMRQPNFAASDFLGPPAPVPPPPPPAPMPSRNVPMSDVQGPPPPPPPNANRNGVQPRPSVPPPPVPPIGNGNGNGNRKSRHTRRSPPADQLRSIAEAPLSSRTSGPIDTNTNTTSSSQGPESPALRSHSKYPSSPPPSSRQKNRTNFSPPPAPDSRYSLEKQVTLPDTSFSTDPSQSQSRSLFGSRPPPLGTIDSEIDVVAPRRKAASRIPNVHRAALVPAPEVAVPPRRKSAPQIDNGNNPPPRRKSMSRIPNAHRPVSVSEAPISTAPRRKSAPRVGDNDYYYDHEHGGRDNSPPRRASRSRSPHLRRTAPDVNSQGPPTRRKSRSRSPHPPRTAPVPDVNPPRRKSAPLIPLQAETVTYSPPPETVPPRRKPSSGPRKKKRTATSRGTEEQKEMEIERRRVRVGDGPPLPPSPREVRRTRRPLPPVESPQEEVSEHWMASGRTSATAGPSASLGAEEEMERGMFGGFFDIEPELERPPPILHNRRHR